MIHRFILFCLFCSPLVAMQAPDDLAIQEYQNMGHEAQAAFGIPLGQQLPIRNMSQEYVKKIPC